MRADARASAGLPRAHRSPRSEISDQRSDRQSAGRVAGGDAGLTSDVCPLTSAAASLRRRARGWARAQHMKGIWWMPWYREAMKDVARCEKPRGGASAR
jgi:hypothetical protein